MEQRLAEQHNTIIGRDGDNYRGNRQNPLDEAKLGMGDMRPANWFTAFSGEEPRDPARGFRR